MKKIITRDDLLQRIETGSPYEAVIVAAREARRLNKVRLAKQSMMPPLASLVSLSSLPGGGGEAETADHVEPDLALEVPEHEPVLLHETHDGGAVNPFGMPPAMLQPRRRDDKGDPKVTIAALERVVNGQVTYTVGDTPLEEEE